MKEFKIDIVFGIICEVYFLFLVEEVIVIFSIGKDEEWWVEVRNMVYFILGLIGEVVGWY